MFSSHRLLLFARREVLVAVSLLLLGAIPVHAADPVTNLNFATVNQNPYAPGTAFVAGQTINIPDPLLSGKLNLGKLNTDPAGAALSFLGDLLGLPVDKLASVTLSPTGDFTAGLTAGYHINGGQLDLNYSKSVQLHAPDGIQAGKAFTISAGAPMIDPFQNKISASLASITAAAGLGYGTLANKLALPAGTFTLDPGFNTTTPYADANLGIALKASGDVTAKVCLLFICGSGDLNLGSVDFSSQVVEASTISGIKILDEPFVQFGHPYDVGGFADITVNSPQLNVDGTLRNNGDLKGSVNSNVLTAGFNTEQLIPVIGPLLHGSVGPFGYDLLSVTPSVSLGVYQKLTFDPHLKVDLQFSDPVNYNGSVTNNVLFDYGSSVTVTPATVGKVGGTFKIKPTFVLDNDFTNQTGLSLSGSVDVSALSLLDPVNVGPAFQTSLDLGTIDLPPLVDNTFSVGINPITGSEIDLPRSGDLNTIFSAAGAGFNDPSGNPVYNLYANNGQDFLGQGTLTGTLPSVGCQFDFGKCLPGQTLFVSTSDIMFGNTDLGTTVCISCGDGSVLFSPDSAAVNTDIGNVLFSDLSSIPDIPTPDQILATDSVFSGDNFHQNLTSTAAFSQPLGTTPIPEPGTLALFGTGMAALAGLIRRKR